LPGFQSDAPCAQAEVAAQAAKATVAASFKWVFMGVSGVVCRGMEK
jgi:hypothetical protein